MGKRITKGPNARRKGCLREVGISAVTLRRYQIRIHWFFIYLQLRNISLPKTNDELDYHASNYLEHLWREGEPEGWATDFVSGLRRLVPCARRLLPTTRFYLSNWRRTISRTRALPFTPLMVRGLAGVALADGNIRMAAVLLLGFVALLRTDELLQLQAKHFSSTRTSLGPYSLFLKVKVGSGTMSQKKSWSAICPC